MRKPGPGSPAPFGQSPEQPANAPAHMVARPATAARCDARRQRRARIGLRAQQPRAGHRGDPGPRARRARATFLPERRPHPSWAGKVPCRDRPIAVATKRAARALQPTATARGRRCGLPVRGALASHESPRRRRSAACKFWSFFLGIYLAARPEKIASFKFEQLGSCSRTRAGRPASLRPGGGSSGWIELGAMLARLRAIFGGAPEEANEQGWPRPSPAANLRRPVLQKTNLVL